ncbi:MAG: hypothetical protein J7J09_00595 [Kosmotoga sp.]|uniref:hypothetical protein n=1 Tax=Kosmotoga sp. TaxID=1955248 RepID=UPI0025BF133D|nr:hypothetical protein [Kosmotoga sp.]MCD6159111.1 hypothetical protein [Kosmotoga sp.]
MLYRLVFSVVPIILFPRFGFSISMSILVTVALLTGTLIGNKHWIPQLQTLTIFLIFALSILGYFRGQNISSLEASLRFMAFGYLFLGIEGSAFSLPFGVMARKIFALIASVLFAIFVAWGLSMLAFEKMGGSGIALSIFLMGLVSWRDVHKIIQMPFEGRHGEN